MSARDLLLPTPPPIDRARLDRALAWATDRYRDCDVCAARCHVDRTAGPAGVCGLGEDARVYKEYLHLGEEACLVPSHAVYMTGCSFRCAFCSDDPQVRAPLAHGVVVPPEALARRIAERRAQGATNVNFVGGVPDVNVLAILRTLAHCPPDTHVVWNTNLWTTPEAVDHLDGVVGTWLVDLKFGNDRCGRRLAGVDAYWDTLTTSLDDVAARGGNVLVRHLLMPGHLDCCTLPTLRWLAARHPAIPVNVMTGYHPYRMARGTTPMRHTVPTPERDAALSALAALPFARPLIDGVSPRAAPTE